MNLYKIKFEHFAPKGSKQGIITYLLAKSDEEVYGWMKSEPAIDDEGIYSNYKYKEEDGETYDIYDDDWSVIGQETFKEKMIRIRGNIHDSDADVSGAFYGVTLYGWECVKENISKDITQALKYSGVSIQET